MKLPCAAVCALIVTLARLAAAADEHDASTILLVVDASDVALRTRVAAELGSLGFSVEDGEPADAGSSLALRARVAGAVAAVEIRALENDTFHITVVDRVTGKTVGRELSGQPNDERTTRELLALQTSELLRASLMEVEAPHPPRGEVPPSDVVHEVAATTRPVRSAAPVLAARTGVLLSPGLSAAPLLEVASGLRFPPRWSATLTLATELAPSTRQEAEGELRVIARWLDLGGSFSLLPNQSRITLALDAGFTLVVLSASGDAQASGVVGEETFTWVPAVHSGIESATRIASNLWWTLRPAVGVALIEPAVRVADRDAVVWGRPWVQCSTGLMLELP